MTRTFPRRPSLRTRLRAAAVLLLLVSCGGEPPASGRLTGERFTPWRHELGPFQIAFEGTDFGDARLRVLHGSRTEGALLESVAGRSFLEIARGRVRLAGEGAERFVEGAPQERCIDQTVDEVEAQLYVLRLSGRLRCAVLDRAYELYLVPEGRDQLRLHVRLADASFNRIALTLARDPDARVFGTGSRARFEHAGRRVAVLVTGTGRAEPTGFARLRAALSARFGRPAPPRGSSAPAPQWITSSGQAVLLENGEASELDFRRPGETRVEVHASELTVRVLAGDGPVEALAIATAATGRPPPLPAWVHAGPIVSAGGGIGPLRALLASLSASGVMPTALHVRDASAGGVGPIDRARYPEWEGLVASLASQGIRLVLDAGPLLHDEALQAQARAADYLVRTAAGEPYPIGEPPGHLLDLSRPDVRAWFVERLQASRIAAGASGLRLLDGEAMPFDGRVGRDRESARDHNLHAQRLTRAAARAFAESERPVPGAVFSDAAFVRSPGHGTILGVGAAGADESLVRALSAGISGFAHVRMTVAASDSPEAVARALLLAAFTPVLWVEAEALETERARAALARAARIHAAWAGYRAELARQANAGGLPLLRPLWLHHPEVAAFQGATPDAFLIGTELLVVPAPAGAARVETTLPAGRWFDVFDGTPYGDPGAAASQEIAVRADHPAVLHPEGSIVGERLRRALSALD